MLPILLLVVRTSSIHLFHAQTSRKSGPRVGHWAALAESSEKALIPERLPLWLLRYPLSFAHCLLCCIDGSNGIRRSREEGNSRVSLLRIEVSLGNSILKMPRTDRRNQGT